MALAAMFIAGLGAGFLIGFIAGFGLRSAIDETTPVDRLG